MTKTLTKQWRDGTLPDGFYYVVSKWSGKIEINDYYNGCWQDLKEEYIKEVLASVPTYAEFNDLMSNLEHIDKCRELVSKTDELVQKMHILENKLDIAVKCLKEYASPEQWEDCTDENGALYFKGLLCDEGHLNAAYALKKIKEVK